VTVPLNIHLFFVRPEDLAFDELSIAGTDARHIAGPLRLQPGDQIMLADGQGGVGRGLILAVRREGVDVRVIERGHADLPLCKVLLYQGIPKGAKMDEIVAGATELGVDVIVPFQARRTVVRLDEAWAQHRLARWRRIAAESAKVARRVTVPEILEPESSDQVIEELASLDLALIPWEESADLIDLRSLRPDISSAGLVIGPEGGLHPEEIQAFARAGAKPVSLGPNILRTETAALAALALLAHALEARTLRQSDRPSPRKGSSEGARQA